MSNLPPQIPGPLPGPPPLSGAVNDVPFATPVMGSGRPGALTAMAIIGIILAGSGILFNLILIMSWPVMQRANKMMAAGAAPPGAAVAATTAPAALGQPVEFVATNGFSAEQRKTVLEGLNQVHSLSAARQELVNELLADAGQRIIRLSEDYLTSQRVALYVNDSKTEPGADGATALDVFSFTTGTLRVSDKSAEFTPTGGAASFRIEGGRFIEGEDDHPDAMEIGAVIARVQKLAGSAMNPAQMTHVQTELEATDQTLVAARPTPEEMAAQVKSAQVNRDGSVSIRFVSGESLQIDTSGADVMGNMGGFNGRGAVFNAANSSSQVPSWGFAMIFFDAVLSLLAAILLLVVAILILKNVQMSRRLAIGYAVFKLIVLFGGGMVAMFWLGTQMDASAGGGFLAVRFMEMQALVAIYVIALLIVMLRKSIREYYANPVVGRIYY